MCLVVIAFQVVDDAPVLVAANREEFYTRSALPPQMQLGNPPVLCGIDRRAGGTWLGVNGFGVVVGVTNRNDARESSAPALRSRGLLCVDLLALPSAEAAMEAACRELRKGRYAGCNLFCVDRHGAFVVHWSDPLKVASLPAGIHVLASGDVDDFQDSRILRAHEFLTQEPASGVSEWMDRAGALCRLHGELGPPICLHGQDRGTVSSTVIALPQRPGQARYLHSNGPPCTSDYEDFSGILCEEVLAG